MNRRRRRLGAATIESPVMLWILLVLITFPLLNLVTVCLRSYFVNSATHAAALEASRARSFSASIDGELSAIDAAASTVNRYKSSFSNITINSLKTNIVSTDIDSGAESVSATKLSATADTSKSLYQIEVVTDASINPLLTYNLPFLGDVPGLTGPMRINFKSRQYIEFPEGLHI